MKIKFHMLSSILLFHFSMNCFSQDVSSTLDPSSEQQAQVTSPNFDASKEKMIEFHSEKVADHQKVLECIKESSDYASMNDCNKYLEKYLKKNIEEE